jgi:ABC-type branched-subunit amino acid transport system permease subunit
VVLVLALLRIVNSPFGRVLQAIRENEFRAEAIGYRVVVYRTTSSVLSALFATWRAAMLALWLRYNGPDTSLSFEIMMDCLLIVVIGGMGTIYGSVIGAVLFLVAQSYLQDLLRLGQRGHQRPALAVGAALARPLAAVAGRAVCAFGYLLSHRRRWASARPTCSTNLG